MIYRTAKVIDNEDETKTGKVKVRILPELNGVEEDMLPWAEPFNPDTAGTSEDAGVHNPPENESFIRVVIEDKFWKRIKYVSSEYIEGFHPYEDFESNWNIDDLEQPEYPQPHFRRSKSGLTLFENTETGDVGIQHPNGWHVFMNKDGKMQIKNDSVRFEISDDGKVKVEAEEVQIAEGSDSVALFTPLEEVLEKLLKHEHVAPSGPTTPAMDSSKSPLTSLTSKIRNMESEVTTTD